ncbi:MAG TPA: MarR family transcriptional regulator [Paucimonas sp.]|nr:MarR family transcriptional regulator [Paucimonas sp.]
MKERYLRSIRLLAECYQAFERVSSDHIRALGLTPCQFDIIATLGNTPGMTFKELGEKTLITKGTLTGIVDRLEDKGMVVRTAQAEDRRSTVVKLTPRGEREFERVFGPHVAHCKRAFSGYGDAEFAALEKELVKLKQRLDTALADIKTEP